MEYNISFAKNFVPYNGCLACYLKLYLGKQDLRIMPYLNDNKGAIDEYVPAYHECKYSLQRLLI